jgi:murein DD-endopeptidase MepM/ murein hydrolase activator NlpD
MPTKIYLILRSAAGRQSGRASRRTQGVIAALLIALPAPALAEVPAPPGGGFGLPLDCPADIACTVQNYIDHDPGPGWRDHTCGPLSYDGHRGVDFRLPTEIEMRRGVPVVAAAEGTVIIARDGQPDLRMADTGPGKTREARNGNWVAIDHGGGWFTTYAHMMQGSVVVADGQRVTRGDKLGLIGLSGNSDFPHVHFAVTWNNLLLDPFTGQEPSAACGEAAESLWSPAAQAQLAYRGGGLLSAGFLGALPTHRMVMDGIAAPAEIAADAPVLIFWTGSWGLLEGDRLVLTILGPDGEIFLTADHRMERDRATESRWIGKRRREAVWPVGRYRGLYRLERQVGDTTVTVIDVERDITVR